MTKVIRGIKVNKDLVIRVIRAIRVTKESKVTKGIKVTRDTKGIKVAQLVSFFTTLNTLPLKA